MPANFDVLPGLEVPAGDISRGLARMWKTAAEEGDPAPASDDGKATQVNFVLHLGFNTTNDDAIAQFQAVVRLSHRYPCRVVVLCPRDEASPPSFRAKIYGECHLGKSKGDTRCCEFVILSYPMSARQFLENQVSVCLSTDLPLYYWVHRFSSSSRLSDYRYLLNRSKRVIFDSAFAPEDAAFAWPRPESVRDLAHARLLPVRQSLGQFLSAYPTAAIIDGLRGVELNHAPAVTAEARVFLNWVRERLIGCGASPENLRSALVARPGCSFDLRFNYDNHQTFAWQGDVERKQAQFSANLAGNRTELPTAVSLLTPEASLGETMFF